MPPKPYQVQPLVIIIFVVIIEFARILNEFLFLFILNYLYMNFKIIIAIAIIAITTTVTRPAKAVN